MSTPCIDVNSDNIVAFQGDPGAYSHLACLQAAPDYTPMPCLNFEAAFDAVKEHRAARAMIPIDNSLAGRVADIHHLMPHSGLFIIGEHFQEVDHYLMACADADLDSISEVHSHIHALPQCRSVIKELGLKPIVHADTAGACRMVAEENNPAIAAIGSSLAVEAYGLKILRSHVQDDANNVTRFLILAREKITPKVSEVDCMTSFIFNVRSVPAALYKAMGGFATNMVNMTKLESYMEAHSFKAAQFYADIEGHPDTLPVQLAFEELEFFCTQFEILGTYPRSPFRDRYK